MKKAIKIFSASNSGILEQEVNKFLASPECRNLIDIKFTESHEKWSVLILYVP